MKAAWLAFVLLAAGCTKGSQIDPNAPTWGSSKQYSAVSSFLEGTWCQQVDTTGATHSRFVKEIIESIPTRITFRKDGTMELERHRSIAHGKWTATSKGIEIEATDVDGIPVSQVESDGRANDDLRPEHAIYVIRWHALKQARRAHLLTLDPDGKRLDQRSEGNDPDATNSMGRLVYVREMK